MAEIGFRSPLQSNFFDRDKIKKKMDAAVRRSFIRIGGFIRTTARRSIRKRKRSAAPGQPPSSHVGTLKNLIFFSYDDFSKSMIVGPTLSRRKTGTVGIADPVNKTVPEILEFGGTAKRKQKSGETITVKYHKHPYMQPALDIASREDKLRQHWELIR